MTLTHLLVAAGALFLLLGAGALMLPRHVRVERAATLDADAEAILALAASGAGYQRFNPYRDTDPDLAITLFGPETGVGSGFRFEGREGRGTQTVSAVAPGAVHYLIDLGPMGRPAQTIRAEARAQGAHVTWTMQADTGFNPVARVMGLFLDRMVGPTLERGLAKLETAA